MGFFFLKFQQITQMPNNQRVIKIRTHFNLSQKEFAIALNVAQSKVSKVEMGEQNLNTEMLSTIIQLYNINADWVLGLKGEDNVILFNNEFVPIQEYKRIEAEKMVMMEELLKYKSAEIEAKKAEISELKITNREAIPNV